MMPALNSARSIAFLVLALNDGSVRCLLASSFSFVAMICYEGLYPSIPRSANIGARADWLVLISNDAWFGGGMGPAQHYAQNRYRAIETGLPLARVASRGASGIVDGRGREVLRAAPVADAPSGWDTSFGRGKLPLPERVTLFQTPNRSYALLAQPVLICGSGLRYVAKIDRAHGEYPDRKGEYGR